MEAATQTQPEQPQVPMQIVSVTIKKYFADGGETFSDTFEVNTPTNATNEQVYAYAWTLMKQAGGHSVVTPEGLTIFPLSAFKKIEISASVSGVAL